MAKEPPIKLSLGSVELHKILDDENDPCAEAIRAKFSYLALWRYRTGRRLPDVASAVTLAELSRGRLPEKSWIMPPKTCKACGRV